MPSLSGTFLRNAIKKFWHLRDEKGFSESQAAAQCWENYPNIHLVPYEKWKPTKGNASDRRGPVSPHYKMTKKTGPKPKMTKKMRAEAKQHLLRDPDLNNAAIAQRLETNRW